MKSLVLLVIAALAFIPSSHSYGSCPSPSSCHTCPPDWIRWENNCYRYHSEANLNFQEAEAFCNKFVTVPLKKTCSCQTAHLASIESAEENTFLLEEWRKVRGPLGNARFQRLHIGYTDQSEEGNWQWVDGSSSTYTNWDIGEPSNGNGLENCGLMWNNYNRDVGKWNDEGCEDYRNPFFCKFRLF